MYIAIAMLILGFLFATLQYPSAMKKFWKWIGYSAATCIIGLFLVVLWVFFHDTIIFTGPNGVQSRIHDIPIYAALILFLAYVFEFRAFNRRIVLLYNKIRYGASIGQFDVKSGSQGSD